jgi:hypothetical protein
MPIQSFADLDRLIIDPHDPQVAQLPNLQRYAHMRFSTIKATQLYQFVHDAYRLTVAQSDSKALQEMQYHIHWSADNDQLIRDILEIYLEQRNKPQIPHRISHLNFAMALGVKPIADFQGQISARGIGRQQHFSVKVFKQLKDSIRIDGHWSEQSAFPIQHQLSLFHRQAVTAVKGLAMMAAHNRESLARLVMDNEHENFMAPEEFFSFLAEQGITREQWLSVSSMAVRRHVLNTDFGL